MNTILLSTDEWDLVADAQGNIALASDPYAMAQDAASEIRTFAGEVYYNTTVGVPYWTTILGHAPAISYMKAMFVRAALLVPGVTSAQCFITRISGRTVNGQVQITDASGTITAAEF